MKIKERKEKINRYTSLPILLDLLKRKKLVLLYPKTWEDKNDYQIILEYKRREKIHNLFAICFSTDDETIHGWKNYASGISGCLIEFDISLNSINKITISQNMPKDVYNTIVSPPMTTPLPLPALQLPTKTPWYTFLVESLSL
jgi:hypothetical protein